MEKHKGDGGISNTNCKEMRFGVIGGIQRTKLDNLDSNSSRRHRRKRDLIPFCDQQLCTFANL